ncbi:AAA family ATPase [Candidatus Woesearchaeota archaeon]|nr:AAA family ATPase [Candidatus Woesearchaeota archaeon]
MSLFKDMLKDNETIFKNPIALDYDFVPKIIQFRENEQQYIATCVKPLFLKRNGKNLLIYGAPGIGKTVATKHVLEQLEEETEEIMGVYINCWQKNTSYKIFSEMCSQLGYKFTQNKKTDELFGVIKNIVNKKSAVFIFDEIDKLEENDFLYMILEEIYRSCIILITNFKEWAVDMDTRIKSRLTPESLEFKAYNGSEIQSILKDRISYAFYEGVWTDEALSLASQKTVDLGDIRSGLYILKEAGDSAEMRSSRQVIEEDVQKAIKKLDEFTIKKSTDLETDSQLVLEIVRDNTGKKIGDLYKIYKTKGGQGIYKTFQRRIAKLEQNKFIEVEKKHGGAEGSTTIVRSTGAKTLSDY